MPVPVASLEWKRGKVKFTGDRAKTKGLRDELANPEMAEFDRMIEHPVSVPKEKIDQAENTSARSKLRKYG